MSTPPPSSRPQMPGLLAHLDDPYGIVWRSYNILRRLSARRTARFVRGLVAAPRYERPVFILGVPRSGTTLLFELLKTLPTLDGLRGEGHDMWRMYHHPRYTGWDSDRVPAGAVRLGERRFVAAYMYAYVGRQRFVEKTPENTLRIPYLLDLFPDARFVVLKRHPLDVLNSMINGWRHPRGKYRSYFVPEPLTIPDYPPRHQWCFALIDGWRDLTQAPIPEIALAQWSQMTDALLAGRDLVPRPQWTELHFETLLDAPARTLTDLLPVLDTEPTDALIEVLTERLERPVNAMTPPGQAKWRRENPDEVAALLPRVLERAAALGYHLDPVTGVHAAL